MKKFIIKKNKKRPFGLCNLNIINIFNVFLNSYKRKIIFSESYAYNLNDYVAQNRWQKLFGFSFNMSHHHTNSARYVFRYNIQKNVMEIASYCYKNKTRIYKHLTNIEINKEIELEIKVVNNTIEFYIDNTFKNSVTYDKIINIGYKLGLYFGDSQNRYPNAPHDMVLFSNKCI
jgi:outer membrane protein assembly factor BamA